MPRANKAAFDLTVLHDERALERAVRQLVASCKTMRAIHARTGLPPLRDFTSDFAGLCRIVTGQQLSASSAAAIWGRLSSVAVPFNADSILALDDQELRSAGLSSGKIKTIRAVAQAVLAGDIVFDRLNRLPDAAVVTELTRLHGIGPWTAEIYLLFALRRADAFPSGDLALQLATERVLRLKSRPTPTHLIQIAERWRPYRGAAARLLWAEYALQPRERASNSQKTCVRNAKTK